MRLRSARSRSRQSSLAGRPAAGLGLDADVAGQKGTDAMQSAGLLEGAGELGIGATAAQVGGAQTSQHPALGVLATSLAQKAT